MASEKRLIDAEAIARKLKNAHCAECNIVRKIQCSACWVEEVLELLEGDTADAVEVVRCKDCKHFSRGMAVGRCKRDPEPFVPVPYNNYCGFGERRGDNG